MDFNLTKEQELLRDGLSKFLSTRYDLEKSRAAAKTGAGWQPDIWSGFANELGILGAALPEDVGGIGGGPVEVRVIAEALGHALVVEPYVDTVVVAGGLLGRAGGETATSLLPRIVDGTAVVAVAATEAASGHDWSQVATTADRDGDQWVDMYMELEQAVSAAYLAVLKLNEDPQTRARAVSAAKATIGRAAHFIGQQSVQLHGGMGMTEELAIGHYFKRLTAVQYEFGTTDYHIGRYAELTAT